MMVERLSSLFVPLLGSTPGFVNLFPGVAPIALEH
jgi:hypothetical protein